MIEQRRPSPEPSQQVKNIAKLLEYIDNAPDPALAAIEVDDRIKRINRMKFLRVVVGGGALAGAVVLDKFYPLDAK